MTGKPFARSIFVSCLESLVCPFCYWCDFFIVPVSLLSFLHFRVNFMKFQKPEKKIDLDKSEVYKVIHHLDKQPIRGIEVREPLVPSAEDIKNCVQV